MNHRVAHTAIYRLASRYFALHGVQSNESITLLVAAAGAAEENEEIRQEGRNNKQSMYSVIR